MHSLNLKITYNCINNCQFCFSSYLKSENINTRNILKAINIGYDNGCRALVISGGEPTLYQDKVIKYLQYADKIGYKSYTIQTNGYGLSEKGLLYNFLKNFSKNNDISISFSIHGSNELIHEKMTLTKNSFNKLFSAIENISCNTKCKLFSNTVISRLNINNLYDIYKILTMYKFNIIQFAVMHTIEQLNFSIGLLESSYAVHKLASQLIDISRLRTEGIPYCLMYGLEECVGESYWPEKLDIFNSSSEYVNKFNQINSGMRKKAIFCNNCIMNDTCVGVWTEHIEDLSKNCHAIA